MIEKAVIFGEQSHLVGIVNIPASVDTERPAVVFLNAGLLHRVGPYRLHVGLCRMLADRGYLTMRFDLSGIGDSRFPPTAADNQCGHLEDIKTAMNFLEKNFSGRSFILVGLCYGASNGLMMAVTDQRVVGLTLIDGFYFLTHGFYRRVMVKYFKSPGRFFSTLGKIIRARFTQITRSKDKHPTRQSMFSHVVPPRDQLAREFDLLARRDVGLLVIYSGGLYSYYNNAGQFLEMFPDVNFRDTLRLEYFDQADHTFTSIGERKKLMAAILEWIDGRFAHEVASGIEVSGQATVDTSQTHPETR